MSIKVAGFSKRLFAHNIDLTLLMLLFIPIYLFIDEQREFLLVSILVSIFYFSLLESSKMQATIGKRIANLSVVTNKDNRLTVLHAFVRTLMKFFSILLLFVCIVLMYVRKDKKGLHDVIVRTLVKENI